MRMHSALLLVAMFAVFPLDGVAGEKQVVDVKELAGSWRGWVTGEQGQERATMVVGADGSYKASTTRGSTAEDRFYIQDGTLGIDRHERRGSRGFPKTEARPFSR